MVLNRFTVRFVAQLCYAWTTQTTKRRNQDLFSLRELAPLGYRRRQQASDELLVLLEKQANLVGSTALAVV